MLYGDVIVIREDDQMKKIFTEQNGVMAQTTFQLNFKRNGNIQNVYLYYIWIRNHSKWMGIKSISIDDLIFWSFSHGL